MSARDIMSIVVVGLVLLMVLGNRKVRVSPILLEQVKVFSNDRRKRLSAWDLTCFIVLPIALGEILSFQLGCVIDIPIATALTAIYSIVFTILFGFSAILVTKLEEANGQNEKRIAKETFVSLITCSLLALVATVLSIVLLIIGCTLARKIISFVIWSLSFMLLMLILMVSKRTYKLFMQD